MKKLLKKLSFFLSFVFAGFVTGIIIFCITLNGSWKKSSFDDEKQLTIKIKTHDGEIIKTINFVNDDQVPVKDEE